MRKKKHLKLIDMCYLALQTFDKGVVTEDHLEELLHINFDTGEMEEKYEKCWKAAGEGVRTNFYMILYDKNLISSEVLLEKTFGKKQEIENEFKNNRL